MSGASPWFLGEYVALREQTPDGLRWRRGVVHMLKFDRVEVLTRRHKYVMTHRESMRYLRAVYVVEAMGVAGVRAVAR